MKKIDPKRKGVNVTVLVDAAHMLASLEYDRDDTCPYCAWHHSDGHDDDCKLAAILRRLGLANPTD